MQNTAELAERPLSERLQAMEALWDSLCREPHYDPSPVWHEPILIERRKELEQGQHSPWAQAKSRLRGTLDE